MSNAEPANPTINRADVPAAATSGEGHTIRLKIPVLKPVRFSFKEIAVFLLILNLFGLVALYVKMERDKPPLIGTVAVSRLATIYETALAKDPANTPDIIHQKTILYMALTEKAIKQLAAKEHMVILIREAVLTGEARDMTPMIEDLVNRSLQKQDVADSADAPDLGGFDDATKQ